MEYEKLTLNELRNIAKEEGIKGISGLKKSDLIELLNRKEEDSKKDLKEDMDFHIFTHTSSVIPWHLFCISQEQIRLVFPSVWDMPRCQLHRTCMHT